MNTLGTYTGPGYSVHPDWQETGEKARSRSNRWNYTDLFQNIHTGEKKTLEQLEDNGLVEHWRQVDRFRRVVVKRVAK